MTLTGIILTRIIILLAIGATAGWLAGTLMKGSSFGLVGNIIVGVIGAVVGGFVFNLLGISVANGLIGSVISATLGAVLLLFIIRTVKKV